MSPGRDRDLGDADRLAVGDDPAPAPLILRVGAAGEDRQRHRADLPRIAHVAVEHGARRALPQRPGVHQLAPERERRRARGCDIDLVRPQGIEGLEHQAETALVRRRRDLEQGHSPADQRRARHGGLDGGRQELVVAAERVQHVAELRGRKFLSHGGQKRVGNLGHGAPLSGWVGRSRSIRVAITGW